MTSSVQRASRRQKKADDRYLAVLENRTALLPGDRCPVCSHPFRGVQACGHGWADVRQANARFLIGYIRTELV